MGASTVLKLRKAGLTIKLGGMLVMITGILLTAMRYLLAC